MALETGTYISDLVSSNPAGTDTLDKADDHLRLIKSTVQATFPNITGAVTPTHTELNYVDGVTSAIQTQLDAKSPIASPTFTGTPAAPTAAVDTNTTQIATTAYVVGQGYAKLASPALTGTPTAPTAAVDTNTTQVASTAYVVGQGYAKLASPTFTGVVATQAGSAALPALIPTGDTNTGLWFPAADTIAASTAGSERIRIDSSGNVLVTGSGGLGYGTGSGGTVTQLTSKSTGVTLHKTNGQIVVNAAALGATTTVAFQVLNNTVAATDNVLLTLQTGGTANAYQIWVRALGAGAFDIAIRNLTGGSLSESITIGFAVIKAVTA